jgi:aminoglycoside phosphotransferase (APT) family kinase protein
MEAALTRAEPSESTMRWLLESLESSEVVSCEHMPGGSTSAMHRVTVRSDHGATAAVVMRRYVLESYLAAEPDAPISEITGLRLSAGLRVPTPGLLAADPEGLHCDAPTIVMRALDGRPKWDLSSRQLDLLVDALIEIHAVDPHGVDVRAINRYRQSDFRPPRWVETPAVWERAVEIFHGPIPDRDVVFAHRDFHPGNVLWHRGHITGVVDWQAACIAPASIDISHCRLNLAFYDPDLPELLRVTWGRRSGRSFDPWADVMTVIGALDHLRDTLPASGARRTIDEILTAAVTELGR